MSTAVGQVHGEYALSAHGRAWLSRWITNRRMLAAFDFDGTLAPIVLSPDKAAATPAARTSLRRLRTLCPVAVITGRARADVLPRIGVELDYVLGNHGLEGGPLFDESASHAPLRALVDDWRRQLDDGRVVAAAAPQAWMEQKELTLSLHYRLTRDPAQAHGVLLQLARALTPEPRVVAGKCVLNLLPMGVGDKGTALRRVLTMCDAEAAIFVGDDETDEAVFELRDVAVLGIRVGTGIQTSAPLYLHAMQEVPALIDVLIRAFETRAS